MSEMPCIKIQVRELTKGFWPSMHKLANENGLEFGTKIRIGAILKDIAKQADDMQKKYEATVDALNWVTDEAGQKTCAEPEKKSEIEESFLNTEIFVLGKKLKAEKLKTAKISAQDLIALAPIIDGLEELGED